MIHVRRSARRGRQADTSDTFMIDSGPIYAARPGVRYGIAAHRRSPPALAPVPTPQQAAAVYVA